MKTVVEVAQMLAISPSKCYELIAKRLLGHHRIGGSLRVSDQQLSDYLDQTRQEPSSEKKGPRPRPKKLEHIKQR